MYKDRMATIFVGLNDSFLHEQKYDTEKYVSILKRVCQNYKVAFSVDRISGGYIHDDGTYVEENSLELKLLNVEDDKVREIAKDLCAFFNQESVMVVYSAVDVEFVRERIIV